ncbi:hypothetical protein F5J12DRAFT_899779 [Pisolithus orientalis]|uniref:uncharacterized protein n=1 Tax=Pisolithus orientalis TaxID=936130 RepID=UPI00222528ED|nr:uncharacterized protein F5J12DRAFT_899779 [Pisolithus orientalis]KAI5983298.1 hypothetical protein F5J12DRAFT_899779 [Pisolithus orientalis]
MKAKLKERKRWKAAEQAWQEEQVQLKAKRVAREKAEAERAERERAKAEKAVWEAKEKRVCKEEERQEAEHKHKAKASKGDEAGAGATSSEARGETAVTNSGQITNALEVILDESYGYGMPVSPSDSGSSELNPEELCKEAKWLEAGGKGKEAEGEGKDMAK